MKPLWILVVAGCQAAPEDDRLHYIGEQACGMRDARLIEVKLDEDSDHMFAFHVVCDDGWRYGYTFKKDETGEMRLAAQYGFPTDKQEGI